MNRSKSQQGLGKASILKRMNCFKQQNSEENPLLALTNSILKSKSASSLKNNEINIENTLSPIQQLKQLEEKQNLTMAINSSPVIENFTPQKIQEMYSPPEIINYEHQTGFFYKQNNQAPFYNPNFYNTAIVFYFNF